MSLFRAIIISLVSVLFFYVAHQLVRFTELPLIGALGVLLFLGLMFALVLSLPLYAWSQQRIEHKPWHDSLFSAAHFSMAYLNFVLTLVILRDIAAFVVNYLIPDPPAWMNLTSLYSVNALGLLLVLPFLMILMGTIVVKVGPKVKAIVLEFSDLPEAWDGTRILHITDLHIGTNVPLSFVGKLAKLAKIVQPDLIVYTGDILDGQPIRHLTELELLKQLKAPLGSFYVPGNHEYYWQIEQVLAACRSIGLNVLMNSTATLEKSNQRLQISGIPDPEALFHQQEGPDFRKFSHQLFPASFRILLSHQPSFADEASKHGFHLQLSGHTHGGQFFPWNFLIVFFQKYSKGLYQIEKMKLYVSQGAGYWGPSLRMGTYCEVTEITLKKS